MSKTNNGTIEVGDTVRICLANLENEYNIEAKWLTYGMKRFDGRKAKVTKVISAKGFRSYELEDITNKKGLPYTWCQEALIKLKDKCDGCFGASMNDCDSCPINQEE